MIFSKILGGFTQTPYAWRTGGKKPAYQSASDQKSEQSKRNWSKNLIICLAAIVLAVFFVNAVVGIVHYEQLKIKIANAEDTYAGLVEDDTNLDIAIANLKKHATNVASHDYQMKELMQVETAQIQ